MITENAFIIQVQERVSQKGNKYTSVLFKDSESSYPVRAIIKDGLKLDIKEETKCNLLCDVNFGKYPSCTIVGIK